MCVFMAYADIVHTVLAYIVMAQKGPAQSSYGPAQSSYGPAQSSYGPVQSWSTLDPRFERSFVKP